MRCQLASMFSFMFNYSTGQIKSPSPPSLTTFFFVDPVIHQSTIYRPRKLIPFPYNMVKLRRTFATRSRYSSLWAKSTTFLKSYRSLFADECQHIWLWLSAKILLEAQFPAKPGRIVTRNSNCGINTTEVKSLGSTDRRSWGSDWHAYCHNATLAKIS